MDFTTFNKCTNEDVHIIGTINEEVHTNYVGDEIHYGFSLQTSFTGIGIISGKKYREVGHATENQIVQVIHNIGFDTFTITNDNITNKLLLLSAGGNTLASTAFYHFKLDADGRLVVDKARIEFDECKD